jgi:hypothetical protein
LIYLFEIMSNLPMQASSIKLMTGDVRCMPVQLQYVLEYDYYSSTSTRLLHYSEYLFAFNGDRFIFIIRGRQLSSRDDLNGWCEAVLNLNDVVETHDDGSVISGTRQNLEGL